MLRERKNPVGNSGADTTIFTYKNYLDFVRDKLIEAKSEEGRGFTRKLAEALQCHTTFISQVVNQKADFSVEQGISFCRFFRMDIAATEYFIDLLGHSRAGNEDSRAFFRSKLNKQQQQQIDLKQRWAARNSQLSEGELEYFGSWIIQAVHATGDRAFKA